MRTGFWSLLLVSILLCSCGGGSATTPVGENSADPPAVQPAAHSVLEGAPRTQAPQVASANPIPAPGPPLGPVLSAHPLTEAAAEEIGRRYQAAAHVTKDEILAYKRYHLLHPAEPAEANVPFQQETGMLRSAELPEGPRYLYITAVSPSGAPVRVQLAYELSDVRVEDGRLYDGTFTIPSGVRERVVVDYDEYEPWGSTRRLVLNFFDDAGRASESVTLVLPVPELDVVHRIAGSELELTIGEDYPLPSTQPYDTGEWCTVAQAYGVQLEPLADDIRDWSARQRQPRFTLQYQPQVLKPGERPWAILQCGSSTWSTYYEYVEFEPELVIADWRYDYAAGTLTVWVDSPDLLNLILPDGGLLTQEASPRFPAVFALPLQDAPYAVKLRAADGYELYTIPVGGLAFALPPDSLHAWPATDTVRVGEPVRITVGTGLTAWPLQFVNGVRLTAPGAAGLQYVRHTFNAGAPGGHPGFADGAWALAVPQDGFLLPPDSLLRVGMDAEQSVLDFNLTPLGGREQRFAGELFNFEVTFAQPGTYELGFTERDATYRTFYSGAHTAPARFWGDIRNAAVPDVVSGRITVLPAD
jgi:hypothetical protein